MRLFSSRLPAAALVALFVISLGGCTMWREPKVHTWKTATGGAHFEQLFWNEVRAGNRSALESRVGMSFSAVVPEGRMDRDQFLAWLRQFSGREIVLGEVEVKPNAADVMVTYRFRQRGPDGAESERLALSIWQRVGEAWILIAHAQTPATGAAPSPAASPAAN